MAHLATTTTSGKPAWNVYVSENPQWKSLPLQVEHGVKKAILYKKLSNGLTILTESIKEKESLALLSNKTVKINNVEYAEVKYKNFSGIFPLKHIRKPSKAGAVGTTGDEQKAIEELDKLIKTFHRPITICVKNHTGKVEFKIPKVVGCRKINGTPKADFALVNDKNQNVFWISHKAAGGASAFQQYSGVTETAGAVIYNHPEVQKFLLVVGANISKEKLKFPILMIVKSKKLINYAIFGPDFDKPYGENHVNLIAQGSPKLVENPKDETEVFLEWSDSWSVSGDLSHFNKEFLPVLGATFRAGRGFKLPTGKEYRGGRVGIYPWKLMQRSGLREARIGSDNSIKLYEPGLPKLAKGVDHVLSNGKILKS